MSDIVIFSVGVVVFAITVWGSVMIGGSWLGQQVDGPERTGSEPATPPDMDGDLQ